MQYDVLIVGAGICGCAVAYTLSKYSLKVMLVDKENDVSMGATRANSGIIHAGYDPENGTLMAKFNVLGSKRTMEIAQKLSVPYKKIGSLVVAFSDEENQTLEKLYHRGIANGVKDLHLLSKEETILLEPNLNSDITGALLARSAAVISPWEFALALAQSAVLNEVSLSLETEVTDIKKDEDGFVVKTSKGNFNAKTVINAAGIFADKVLEMTSKKQFNIVPSKGEYYLLDKSQNGLVNHIIFQCPTANGKGILVSPTAHGNVIVGPNSSQCDLTDTATSYDGLEYVRKMSLKTIPSINFRENIRNFAGVRANSDQSDFIFGEDPYQKGFFNIAGIKSPGLSSAVSLAEEMAVLLEKSGMTLTQKSHYKDLKPNVHFNSLSSEARKELIERNPLYGRVICRCETVTEGEIMDALSAPIPPVSIDGIKRRVGTGMGRCQGGFCSPKIHDILSVSLNKSLTDINLDAAGSYILVGETKKGGVNK